MEDINCWEAKFQSCCYSDKLLKEVILLNKKVKQPVDIHEITKAIYYARKYHGSQMRQSGDPFYSHPVEVAYLLAQHTALETPKLFRTDMVVTALLHDCLEDTTLTESMISDIFDAKIASQVEDLTRVKPSGKISAAESLSILFQQEKYDMALVKIFDRMHNLQTLGAKSPEKARKIVEETIKHFVPFCKHLEIPKVEQELIKLCYQNLSIVPLNSLACCVFSLVDNLQNLLPTSQNELVQMQNLSRLATISLLSPNNTNIQYSK
jgi:(p)ppGpp synthase/HD superfamily hydrolase